MDQESDKYVDSLMKEQNPVIVRQSINILHAYIGKNILNPEKFSAWDLTRKIPSIDISSIEKYGNKSLINYRSGKVLIKDFLDWYEVRKSYLKYNKSSVRAFFASMQQFVWRMLRDKLLIEQSIYYNIQNRQSILTQQKWWEEKIVYSVYTSNLASAIQIDEDMAKRHYEQNKQNYLNASGKIIPYEKTERNIKSELYREEYKSRIIRRVLALKKKYVVNINEDVLKNISVEEENNPKAIDVYMVKKGGTLPRQPYPSIDWEWQSWY